MEILSTIGELAIKFIGQELSYLCLFNSNIKELENQVRKLKDARDTLQQRVYEAERNAEDIESRVRNWLTKVDEIIKASQIILANGDQCSCGMCVDIVKLQQLSKGAKQLADQIVDIMEEGNFTAVSYKVSLSSVGHSTKTPDFMDFESRNSTIEQIIEALKDDNINRIGVHGMGGVGKTMLVKEISRKVKEENLFIEVVTSTISQTPDMRIIQGELGDKLGLKFDQETIEGRASKLHKRLKMAEKILIVLDDVWDYIDLDMIGIPCVEDHKGCKILLTSRDKHTLSNDMSTNKNFEVKVLQHDESWNLFKKVADGKIIETSNVGRVAIQIVKECAQLPIAIATIAKALRNKPLAIWKDSLNQLRKPVAGNIKGMNGKVYSSLRLSYAQLESEEAKLLFLLCSMFPDDFNIHVRDLHIYAMGMGILQGVDTLEEGRDRIATLVDNLTSSSLLLEYEVMDYAYVKMHDLVRDVAIIIASEHVKIRTLSYVKGLSPWKEDKTSSNYTAVYLEFGDIQDPPQNLKLSEVQLLILSSNKGKYRLELQTTFFDEMKELKVLELSNMKISLPPPSCCSLANLQSLYLAHCELTNIDMIGELKNLEVLSFKSSNIIEIPPALARLTRLKMLDLSSCHQLEVIQPNIFSRLTKLEELDMENSFTGWGGEESGTTQKNASIYELKYLSCLSSLNIHIPTENVMQEQLFSSEVSFKRFKISIGSDKFNMPARGLRSSKIVFFNMELESHLYDWIQDLLKESEELHIKGSFNQLAEKHVDIEEFPFNMLRFIKVYDCCRLKNLFYIFNENDLVNLEQIEISNCKMVEVIVIVANEESMDQIEFTRLKSIKLRGSPQFVSFCSKTDELDQVTSGQVGESKYDDAIPFFNRQVSLPNLESLKLIGAYGLKMIISNEFIPHSFTKLKTLEIAFCRKLKMVFPSNIMAKLTCLETIKIEHCGSLEGIFEAQDPNASENCDGLFLPRLNSLELYNLPDLKYVWRDDPQELQVFQNLLQLSIQECPQLIRVYPLKVLQQLTTLETNYRNLMQCFGKEKLVKMVDSSKDEIIELPNGPDFFSKLKKLKLVGSEEDKWTDLPMEIVERLHKLEELDVSETLFDELFPFERVLNGRTFYTLRKLCLTRLPNLKQVLNESLPKNTSSVSFGNLVSITIHACDGLTHLLNPSTARTLVQLGTMNLSYCKSMTTIITEGGSEEEPDEVVFNKLFHLQFHELPGLMNFHSGKCAMKFPQLKYLFVMCCPEMKDFSLGITNTPCLSRVHIQFNTESNKLGLLKEEVFRKDIATKDINVIVRQAWENNCEGSHQENLEELQSDPSPSQV